MRTIRWSVIAAVGLLLTLPGITSADLNDGLVGYWPFDDGNVNDFSGNENDGIPHGEMTYPEGVKGLAASFDGVDDYIELQYTDVTPSITFSAWVSLNSMPTSSSDDQFFVFITLEDYNGGYFLRYQYPSGVSSDDPDYNLVSGVLTFSNALGRPTWLTSMDSYEITTNEWFHLAMVYNSVDRTLKNYLNGSIVSEAVEVTPPSGEHNTAGTETYFGRSYLSDNVTGFLDGLLDEVRIYDRALSMEEIQQLFLDATDNDGDGFLACDDAGVCNDCNDDDPSIKPGAIELPGNFTDENCDGNLGDCDPCTDDPAWKNHGQYVRCVAHTATGLVERGDITEEEGDALVTFAAQSKIGKKGFVPAECQ